ncbi:hypothetical protein V9K97_25610 [Variovorax sp. CCNWLW186]|uniref:hypothetical protein n=1 Tax=Variovorax sp. CCNWLW186 TaxID=3127473 RepID=UPI003076F922
MSNALSIYTSGHLSIDLTEQANELTLLAKLRGRVQCAMPDALIELDKLITSTSTLSDMTARYMETYRFHSAPIVQVGEEFLGYECQRNAGLSKFAGGDLTLYSSHLDHQSLKAADSGRLLLDWYKSIGRYNSDELLDAVLVDVSRVDRFDVLPEVNVVGIAKPDVLPRTTSSSNALDERAVAVLRSRQQRDAILLAKDFRNALETLVEEEQLSYYDLTRIIGVTRAMLSQWRERPLEKIRSASHERMGRLLFAWKYWLHVTEGDMLGRYLRHVPEGSTVSLMDLLSDEDPSDEEITNLVDRLARYAVEDRKAGTQRRRDVGGLPYGTHRSDLAFD